ncbi:MAG: hypothetical protein O7G85_10430 [Planctomycetota bacterium]|nr:hypothetical protein [Planctomycetota bacterium]
MTNDDDKTYPLQPEGDSDTPPPEEPSVTDASEVEGSRGVEALPLEDLDLESLNLPDRTEEVEEEVKETFELEVEPESDYIDSLDICPNCGKTMEGVSKLLCVHCGYDIKSMHVIKIKRGEVTEEELEAESKKDFIEPLCRKGWGNFHTPAIMAGIALGVLFIGYAMRSTWLLDDEAGNRFLAFVVSVLWLVPLIGCSFGALYTVAHLLERPLGRFKLAWARVAGIVCFAKLATFISSPFVEFVIEAIAQAGIAFGLSLLLFKVKPKESVLLVSFGFVYFLLFVGVIKVFSYIT